jgi:hypothetical protein
MMWGAHRKTIKHVFLPSFKPKCSYDHVKLYFRRYGDAKSRKKPETDSSIVQLAPEEYGRLPKFWSMSRSNLAVDELTNWFNMSRVTPPVELNEIIQYIDPGPRDRYECTSNPEHGCKIFQWWMRMTATLEIQEIEWLVRRVNSAAVHASQSASLQQIRTSQRCCGSCSVQGPTMKLGNKRP